MKCLQFNLSRWYATQRIKALAMDKARAHYYDGRMGQALSIVARKLLTDGIHTFYPGVQTDLDSEEHFSVCQRVAVPSEYVITDKDSKFHARVSQTLLENLGFDLVGWFVKQLRRREFDEASSQLRRAEPCCVGTHPFNGCSQALETDSEVGVVEDSIYDDLPDF